MLPTTSLSTPFLIFMVFGIIWIIIVFIFYLKLWNACGDIQRLEEIGEDMHFWARAKYESDRRLGAITDEDLGRAEVYCKKKP